MKRRLGALSAMTLIFLLLCTLFSQALAAPAVDFKLLNPPPKNKPLNLEVGESYTFDIQVTSDEPFILAMAMTDAYYPGRGVSWQGNDTAHHTRTAILHLTMTGKGPTEGLPAVCDWPDSGVCWSEGVAPVSIVVGARYKRGVVVGQQFPFAVLVP
jgi:hypothetical protein